MQLNFLSPCNYHSVSALFFYSAIHQYDIDNVVVVLEPILSSAT